MDSNTIPPSYEDVISEQPTPDGVVSLDAMISRIRIDVGIPEHITLADEVLNSAFQVLGEEPPKNEGVLFRARYCYNKLYGSASDGVSAGVLNSKASAPPLSLITTTVPRTAATPRTTAARSPDTPLSQSFPGKISTKDIEGPWICCCLVFCSRYAKDYKSEDELHHNGCCYIGPWPFAPFNETRHRVGKTNGFKKQDGDDTSHHCGSKGRCVCNGLSCAMKVPCFPDNPPGGRTAQRLSAADIAGFWGCLCFPFCALTKKSPIDDDHIRHSGCCFLGCIPMCPYSEIWVRDDNATFYKSDKKVQRLKYVTKNAAYDGAAIDIKIC